MTNLEKLLPLLDEAASLSARYTGGYCDEFLSAEEFHAALVQSITRFRGGDYIELENFCYWFMPSSCWDDFVGSKGQMLANEIYSLLLAMRKVG